MYVTVGLNILRNVQYSYGRKEIANNMAQKNNEIMGFQFEPRIVRKDKPVLCKE